MPAAPNTLTSGIRYGLEAPIGHYHDGDKGENKDGQYYEGLVRAACFLTLLTAHAPKVSYLPLWL